MRKHLIKELKPLLERVNNIPAVNNGGCAFVALAIQEYCTAKGHKADIYYIMSNYDYTGISNLRKQKPDSCRHAVVRIGNHYVDSTGIYSVLEAQTALELKCHVPMKVPAEFVKASLETKNWNNTFDRKRVKTINKILKA